MNSRSIAFVAPPLHMVRLRVCVCVCVLYSLRVAQTRARARLRPRHCRMGAVWQSTRYARNI